MKIDTLSFIQYLLTGLQPNVFHPHAATLVPVIISAASVSFYNISSKALVVLQWLVEEFRPLDSSSFDLTLYTNKIYQCWFVMLKEQAYFRKALKLSTLPLLDTMVTNYSTSLAWDIFSPVLAELPPLLSETDLHIAQLTLNLLTSISVDHMQAIPTIQKTVFPEVLLQGAVLTAMLDFFKSVLSTGVPGMTHSELLALLVDPALGGKGGTIHKQGRANIAKCMDSLVSHSERETVGVVKQFMRILNSNQQDYSLTFSLLAIVETVRGADLSQLGELKPAILAAFNHTSEKVRSIASYYVLENIAHSNLSEFFPFSLHELKTHQRRQYIILQSLKEVISAQSASPSRVQVLSGYLAFKTVAWYLSCVREFWDTFSYQYNQKFLGHLGTFREQHSVLIKEFISLVKHQITQADTMIELCDHSVQVQGETSVGETSVGKTSSCLVPCLANTSKLKVVRVKNHLPSPTEEDIQSATEVGNSGLSSWTSRYLQNLLYSS